MSGNAKKIEARFLNSGNAWDGPSRGWKIKCSQCSKFKVVGSSGRSSMPPNVIVKKLKQAGWEIGHNSKEDVCSECQKQNRRALLGNSIKLAKSTLQCATAPAVETNGHRLQFSELEAAAKVLGPEQAKALINILQDQIPKKVRKASAPQQPPEPDDEYHRWLNEQQ